MDAEANQRRLQFLQYMYGQALRGVTEALELAKQPPLKAEEKEQLFGAIERGVWALPDAWFSTEPPAGWEEEYAGRDAVTSAVEDAVTTLLTGRRSEARPS